MDVRGQHGHAVRIDAAELGVHEDVGDELRPVRPHPDGRQDLLAEAAEGLDRHDGPLVHGHRGASSRCGPASFTTCGGRRPWSTSTMLAAAAMDIRW